MSILKDAISALPFTKDGDVGAIHYWAVEPTGDWCADTTTGRDYADALLVVMREHESPGLLAWVVKAMPPILDGVQAGFLHAIAAETI